jgi:DNA-binding transcriptional LysR family regulator
MSAIDFEVSVPQLRCFIAAANARSVAEAGRQLGMSAASVSKAITRLEHSARVRLLHRSTHAMSLTEEGKALLGPARETVKAASAFEDAAARAADGGDRGSVRITGAIGFVRHVLVPLVGELVQAHPDIHLDVRVTNELVDLADDSIDLALRSGSLARIPGHLHQRWFTTPWVICASPGYLARRRGPRTVRELADHPLVGFRNQRTGRVQPWPRKGGSYEPNPALSFDDGDAVWAAMLGGAGLACAPLYMAAAALRAGTTIEVLDDSRGPDISVSMVRRERHLVPRRLTTVMAFLAARAPKLDDLMPARRRPVRR